jgi:hypothetical protein
MDTPTPWIQIHILASHICTIMGHSHDSSISSTFLPLETINTGGNLDYLYLYSLPLDYLFLTVHTLTIFP